MPYIIAKSLLMTPAHALPRHARTGQLRPRRWRVLAAALGVVG